MSFDAHVDFAYSTVATAPSPAGSGLSLVVTAGEGSRFPNPGTDGAFNAVVCASGQSPTWASGGNTGGNFEVVRVTARSTDTFTITRAQDGSSARTILVGDQIFLADLAKLWTDIEAVNVATDPIWDALGDLAVGTGANTAGRAPIGANDSVLTADSTQGFGLKWVKVGEGMLALTDVTTADVSSTKHGFAPKSPADATKFLNGAATPAWAQVKDSDLSLSDITTNDVSTTKHGFTPKAPNDTAKFLRGDGTWAAPGGGGGGSSSVATDVIWDAKGDLAVATGADAAAKLSVGSDRQFLVADSSQTAGVKWVTGGLVKLYDYTVTGSDKASIDTQVDDGGNGAAALPTTYSSLLIRFISRTDEAVILSPLSVVLNNDTGANYERAEIASTTGGATVSTTFAVSETGLVPITAGASAGANVPGIFTMEIPAYADTTFYKISEWKVVVADTTSGNTHRDIEIGGELYASTSAVTRVKFLPATAAKKFKVGTRLLIYAI